jgi:phasin family protein
MDFGGAQASLIEPKWSNAMTIKAFAPVSVETLFVPFQTISNLAAEKAGKLADIQLTALETYLAVGINQCKAAAAVHSPEDFQTLAGKQQELFKLLGEKALVDMQQIMLLGSEFGAQVQNVVLESSKPLVTETN